VALDREVLRMFTGSAPCCDDCAGGCDGTSPGRARRPGGGIFTLFGGDQVFHDEPPPDDDDDVPSEDITVEGRKDEDDGGGAAGPGDIPGSHDTDTGAEDTDNEGETYDDVTLPTLLEVQCGKLRRGFEEAMEEGARWEAAAEDCFETHGLFTQRICFVMDRAASDGYTRAHTIARAMATIGCSGVDILDD
jgi:hypothetical protein